MQPAVMLQGRLVANITAAQLLHKGQSSCLACKYVLWFQVTRSDGTTSKNFERCEAQRAQRGELNKV